MTRLDNGPEPSAKPLLERFNRPPALAPGATLELAALVLPVLAARAEPG